MADLRWALFRSAAYFRGKGVTFGVPLAPAAAVNSQVYSITVGLVRANGVAGMDEKFDIFADASLDHVCITPMIAAATEPESVVRELSRKLRLGGHLIVLTNVSEIRPGVKELYPGLVEGWVANAGRWIRKAQYEHDGKSLQIYKRVDGKRGVLDAPARATKRALVVRYGALGDAIVMTPLLKQLAQDGYEVTCNINPYCVPALENNPNVHNLLIQERDIIPNQVLGEYWDMWAKDYDKYINLSESIEGDLLMVEGRPSFFTSQSWRHAKSNKNYYDYTMKRGGYDITGTKGELFFTNAEERRASAYFDGLKGKFVIVWALNGSSHHKVYPMMEPTLKVWFDTHPDSVVVTVGDTVAQILEFPHDQLFAKSGKWSIRESLISAKYANLIIGPETMMTNAAGCYATPKITLLSHSTHENLCKHWENDYCLAPAVETAPCYPCHQLHYTRQSCPVGEMKDISTGEILGQSPICSLAVAPERLLERMQTVYEKWASPRQVQPGANERTQEQGKEDQSVIKVSQSPHTCTV